MHAHVLHLYLIRLLLICIWVIIGGCVILFLFHKMNKEMGREGGGKRTFFSERIISIHHLTAKKLLFLFICWPIPLIASYIPWNKHKKYTQ